MNLPQPALLRKLGARDAALLVMGGIIGSGIFVNPSRVAKMLHTTPLIMAAWTIGGIVALIGAGVFAELGARRQENGGVYAYLRDAFHPIVAFAYGWTLLMVSQSGGAAASAVTFAFYLPVMLGIHFSDITAKIIEIAVIAIWTIVTCLGVRESTTAQNTFMLGKIVAIAGIIGIGIFAVGHATALQTAPVPQDFNPIVALGLALVPVMFAYSGWQTTSFMSAEMKEPEKNLPLGMLFGVLGVVTLYLGINVISISVLGEQGLASTNTPASDVVSAALGSVGGRIIAAIIALSTLGFILNQLISAPRVYLQMAQDGTFFGAMAKIDARTHVPVIAIAVQGAITIAIAGFGIYDQILNWVTSVDSFFFAFSAAALILFRRRDEAAGAAKPYFKIPLHPWSTLAFLIVEAFIVIDIGIKDPVNSAYGFILLLSSVPVYYFFTWWHKRNQGV